MLSIPMKITAKQSSILNMKYFPAEEIIQLKMCRTENVYSVKKAFTLFKIRITVLYSAILIMK